MMIKLRHPAIQSLLYFFLFIIGSFCAVAQVGIGTSTPNLSAKLEIATIEGEHKGILIPRIPLLNLTDIETIDHGNIESLLVYNITISSDLSPGYYYWNNKRWNRLLINDDISRIVQSQPGQKGMPETPGSNNSGAPEAGTIILNNDDGGWVYDSARQKWIQIGKNPDNYSYSEQQTGRHWIDGSKVFWKTIQVNNLIDGNEEFDLSSAFRSNEISAVLSIRVVNKATNGISTALLKYDFSTNKLIMGNGMVMPTPHSKGVYYIMIEYIKTKDRAAAP